MLLDKLLVIVDHVLSLSDLIVNLLLEHSLLCLLVQLNGVPRINILVQRHGCFRQTLSEVSILDKHAWVLELLVVDLHCLGRKNVPGLWRLFLREGRLARARGLGHLLGIRAAVVFGLGRRDLERGSLQCRLLLRGA